MYKKMACSTSTDFLALATPPERRLRKFGPFLSARLLTVALHSGNVLACAILEILGPFGDAVPVFIALLIKKIDTKLF